MSNSIKNKLHYRVSGEGRPVLFLHGFLENLSMWDELLPLQGIQAICIDLPHHGKTVAASASIQKMAQLVIELTQELSIKEFDVVGHSMGGYVALEIKDQEREKCKKVVLLNSNFWEDKPAKKRDRGRVAEIVKKQHVRFLYDAIPALFVHPEQFDTEIKQMIQSASEMSGNGIAECALAMRDRMAHHHLLEQHQADFFILQGEEDNVVLQSDMLRELRGMNIHYVELKGVGHMAHFESPEKVIQLISSFLV